MMAIITIIKIIKNNNNTVLCETDIIIVLQIDGENKT